MCCTTLLSMWLSNTSTTAMVMPIVEAVLQELVSAEEEQLVASNSSTEEAEPISTVCWHSSTYPLPPVPSSRDIAQLGARPTTPHLRPSPRLRPLPLPSPLIQDKPL